MVALHELLGEALARFQLRRRLGCAEDRPSALLELIHNAQRERQFGADDGEIRIQAAGKLDERIDALDVDSDALSVGGNSTVAGRAIDFFDAWRLPQLPDDCVLATTTADDQDFHSEGERKE